MSKPDCYNDSTFPKSPLEAAKIYTAANLYPLPLKSATRGDGLPNDWPNLRLTAAELPDHFSDGSQNVALNLGPSGLVCLDLDCNEAILAASVLIPNPKSAYCRSSKHPTHILYRGEWGSIASKQFSDPTPLSEDLKTKQRNGEGHGSLLLEILSEGKCANVPPSIHPSGKPYEWQRFEPGADAIGDTEISGRAHLVAAAALLARHWPNGSRNNASLALAGGLLRAWDSDRTRVKQFVRAVCVAASDDEVEKRVQAVDATAEKLAEKDDGKKISGWPKLVSILGDHGDPIVKTVREWLGIKDAAKSKSSGRLVIRCATEIADEIVTWLWRNLIPLSMLSFVEGDPDGGKTTIVIDLAARVTAGAAFPGETVGRPPRSVLFICSEDSASLTIKPRLRAAGADMSRVHFIEGIDTPEGRRPVLIPDDLADIQAAAKNLDVELIAIDPLMGLFSADVNTHNDQSVRQALHPLKEFAEKTGAAVICLRHLNNRLSEARCNAAAGRSP